MFAQRVLSRFLKSSIKISRCCNPSVAVLQNHGRSFHISVCRLGEIVQFKLADIGEGIKEVTIKEWYVAEGQEVSQFDNICEVQSDKAAVTITSRFDGVIRRLHHAVDDIALVGQALVDIEVEDSGDSDDTAPAPAQPESRPVTGLGKALATPAVRRLAAENKIDLSTIRGTGRDGRILKEDILNFLKAPPSPAAQPPPPPAAQPPPPPAAQPPPPLQQPSPAPIPTAPVTRSPSGVHEDRPLVLTSVVRAMVKTMTQANAIPHFSYCDEVEVDALLRLRQKLKAQGTNISYMPFMIKAASLALNEFPILNTHTDADCQNVVMKGAHNISVAMDTPAGLLVPSIKAVQELSVFDVSHELRRLMELGRAGKLSPHDLAGGTFTLSNIGVIGGTYTRPIILPPQVCIAGIGKVRRLPRFVAEDSLEVRATSLVNVSWVADHRVIDGVTMAKFAARWKTLLESPELMLLHLK